MKSTTQNFTAAKPSLLAISGLHLLTAGRDRDGRATAALTAARARLPAVAPPYPYHKRLAKRIGKHAHIEERSALHLKSRFRASLSCRRLNNKRQAVGLRQL